MFIGDRLRNEFESVIDILCEDKSVEMIKELYQNAIGASLDEEDFGEDSHNTICIVVALCLINNLDKVTFPLSFEEEDEQLLAEVSEQVDFIMNIEKMIEHNLITKSVDKDGKTTLTANENIKVEQKKSNKKKK